MSARLGVLLCLVMCAIPRLAWSDPPVEAPAEAGTAAPAAATPPLVPLEAGQPAQFDGYLVSLTRFDEYLNLQVELRRAHFEIEAIKDEAHQRIADLASQLDVANAAHELGWFDQHKFTIGVVVGIVGACLLVYGAVQLFDVQQPAPAGGT